MEHLFSGVWISNDVMAKVEPRNVFHRQFNKVQFDCTQYRNEHILFRRKFLVEDSFSDAKIFISADDYYKLYINGRFVAQGPSPSYHFQYNYNEIDVSKFLISGENTIAVHTFYQGLINRVWQSGDFRHGMICDMELDGKLILSSDESFLVAKHTAYTEMGMCGYETQMLEQYDSRAAEVGFEAPDYDDSSWKHAEKCQFDDHVLTEQKSYMLEFEDIAPLEIKTSGNRVLFDFGANYVGYLFAGAKGNSGDIVTVRCGQELNDDGSIRFQLRANCRYEEKWILSGKDDFLNWFDYKSFRYAELEFSGDIQWRDVILRARRYPFELKMGLRPDYAKDADMKRIWDLCVNTQKYGVQEIIQDCMEREKGFYLGDGCYSALTNMLLTEDDSMVRKLIDDAFSSSFICDTLVTCMDCSFIQEIAEYPLIMIMLILWHYRYTGDTSYLKTNYVKAVALMEAYRRDYETDGLLNNLDKWCVVEWPDNFRHGYDGEITDGKVSTVPHISINAYYIYAVRIINKIAEILGEEPYRDISPLTEAFCKAFYDEKTGLFFDSKGSKHVSLVGNSFPYAFELCPNEYSKNRILAMIDEHGIDSLSFFCTFPILMRLTKDGDGERMKRALLNEGTWRRMLREDATTTFEGWGKDTKWNTSLFHLTMSYGAIFMADADVGQIFE